MMSTQSDETLEHRVGEKLEEAYRSPDVEIVRGYRFRCGDKFLLADYAVFVAGYTDYPALIVEVKANFDPANSNSQQILKTLQAIQRTTESKTRIILATLDEENDSLVFFEITDSLSCNNHNTFCDLQSKNRIMNNKLPDLGALFVETKEDADRKASKKRDFFKFSCWGCAVAGFILLILEQLKLYEFSQERLTVLAAIALFTLLPNFDSIVVKNIAMQRRPPKEDNRDDSKLEPEETQIK